MFPSLGVVGREPDVGDGDDGLSCGGIHAQASVIETDDVSATSSSETMDLQRRCLMYSHASVIMTQYGGSWLSSHLYLMMKLIHLIV